MLSRIGRKARRKMYLQDRIFKDEPGRQKGLCEDRVRDSSWVERSLKES